MKILRSNLLTTIAIFLLIRELNAVFNDHRQRPLDYLTRAITPTRLITYKDSKFGVWENPGRTVVNKIRLLPVDYISEDDSYELPHDFGIEYVRTQGYQFVAIKAPNGQYVGAEAGKISLALPPGNPTTVFNYNGHQLGVWKHREVAYEARLLSTNFVPLTQFNDRRYFKTHCFYKDGIWILAHAINGKVLGAQLLHEASA